MKWLLFSLILAYKINYKNKLKNTCRCVSVPKWQKSSTAIRITAAVRKRQSLGLKIISMPHVSQSVRIIAKECTRSSATCMADHVSACSSLCACLSSSSSSPSPTALPLDSSSSAIHFMAEGKWRAYHAVHSSRNILVTRRAICSQMRNLPEHKFYTRHA